MFKSVGGGGGPPFSGTQVYSIFAKGDSSSSGLVSGIMDASGSAIGEPLGQRNPVSMPH